ncbi:la-related protein 6 [Protopterus annectens]|uniref:la-related protein 6 n=1 Tax=Protopterus annectens TaxID=7888 RepID=UPI001CFA1A0D|nr:la-related protein 6 [Protopterus annectens]
MAVLGSAFSRWLAFLLPLCLQDRLWVGGLGGRPRSSVSSRYKNAVCRHDQEVNSPAEDICVVSSSSSSCHSAAAPCLRAEATPPPATPGSAFARLWKVWQAFDCHFGAPYLLQTLQKSLALLGPCPLTHMAALEGSPALPAAASCGDWVDLGDQPVSVSVVLAGSGADVNGDQEETGGSLGRGTQVQIRVDIQAAEDEETAPSSDNLMLEKGGSCSEDDGSRHDRHSGAGTSGGENEDELYQTWMPPDPELVEKLIAQIEYYLSDENLEKDAFLLKHVRRNKMGYVSVKLLTSFKKVKHLTRDWRTTAYALRQSTTLELNDEGRKVRRKTPVPVFASENLPSKMLLVYDVYSCPALQAVNKDIENANAQEKVMEHLLRVFGVYGVISSVRILKPGKDLPADIKRLSNRYSQLGTLDCAIIEFEEVESAIKAHESMGTEKDNEMDMKVILIGMKPPKKKASKDKNREEDGNKNARKSKSMNKRVEELQFGVDESPVYSSSEPDSNPASPSLDRKVKNNKLSPASYQNNHLSPNASPRSSPWNSPSVQRKNAMQRRSPLAADSKLTPGSNPDASWKCLDYSSDSSITPSGSPWVQRRKQAQTVSQENSPAGSPMLGRKIQNADGLPPGVLRLPKGPDGTKGFHNGINRGRSLQNL